MNQTAPVPSRRHLRAQLAELVTWLETDDERPELFGSKDEHEWLLRLTAVVVVLVTKHRVDERGRCDRCHHPRRGWQRLLPRWSNRSLCRVLDTAEFFTSSNVDVVWWQALNLCGANASLDEVRAWLWPEESADEPTDANHEWFADAQDNSRDALLTDGRVRLREDTKPAEQLVRPYVPPAAITTQRFPQQLVSPNEAVTEELPKIDKP